MERSSNAFDLGILVCKHCGEVMGSLDTEKVSTFYVECHREECDGKLKPEDNIDSCI